MAPLFEHVVAGMPLLVRPWRLRDTNEQVRFLRGVDAGGFCIVFVIPQVLAYRERELHRLSLNGHFKRVEERI